jgi:hypothetical protein
MKNSSFWEMVKPGDTSKWVKYPSWAPIFLSKIVASSSEILVFMCLLANVDCSSGKCISVVPTALGLEFCGGMPSATFYRAIAKFKQLGLVKVGSSVYDMGGLAKTVKGLMESGKTLNNVELDQPEEGEFDE